MSLRILASLLLLALVTFLPRAARAQSARLRVPALPSVLPERVDQSFLARVGRALADMQPPVSEQPRDQTWRNPTTRDAARERDTTSFGINSASLSPSGAAFAGVGVGASAARLLDLGRTANDLPVRVAPTFCQGGGGFALNMRW